MPEQHRSARAVPRLLVATAEALPPAELAEFAAPGLGSPAAAGTERPGPSDGPGTGGPAGPVAGAEGWVVRDLTLGALVRIAEGRHPWLGVDLDSVEGLNADLAAVRFVTRALGADAVITRRPAVAAAAVQAGSVGLVRVFAFDSTGLRRSLEAIPPDCGVGLVVSPGIVLPYIEESQRARFSHPLVAHGLIGEVDQVRLLLGQADSVVVRPELALAARHAGLAAPSESADSNASRLPLDRDASPI